MSDPVVVSLADRLKSRRAELGISQSQAARELDVARTAYRLWELEAAKPSPDRWKLIARWLGVSVTTMLLAEDMLSEPEASLSELVGSDFGPVETTAQHQADTASKDFFTEARALLSSAVLDPNVTKEQAADYAALLDRLETASEAEPSSPWEPAEVRREIVSSEQAPAIAREAIDFIAAGVPSETLDDAKLLATELVTNSVQHASREGGDRIGLLVRVTRSVLRVEVSDSSPVPAVVIALTASRGHGLAVVAGIATRWGTERLVGRNVTWFEIDLPAPGS
jgi:transcriptional regulator with XRE-family HTH domain